MLRSIRLLEKKRDSQSLQWKIPTLLRGSLAFRKSREEDQREARIQSHQYTESGNVISLQ